MKREITKLFGNRVALQLVEEEYKGLIVPIPNEKKIHCLSNVLAVGDKCPNLKVGDIAFWQTNAMIEKHCRYTLNGATFYVMLSGNVVATLSSRLVTRENFHVIGDWLLLKREIVQPSKRIILPDEVVEANPETAVRYLLAEKGETVDLPLEPGQEVMVDWTRANHIKLQDESYCYIGKNDILGTVA